MAQDFVTRLTLDGSSFSEAMNDAAKQVNDFSKKTEDASKTVDDMGKSTSKTASQLLKEMKTMEGLGRSTSNYRSQLSQMTRQIQDLSINYQHMSDEVKNSDFGREVASKIQELTKQASEYKDALMDASTAVRLLSSDTSNLDAAKSAVEGLSAGMELFASFGILGEENTEKVVKALAKLKAIEASTNAVIKIANVLNKDSILMLKIKELQTRALTKAQVANTAATKGATVAQRAFNVAAKANPYVLLAMAIAGVVTALVKFTKATKEDTEAQEARAAALEKERDNQEQIATTAATSITAYKKLQTQWSNLKTEMEKNQFIKDAKTEFDNLGISVSSIEDAEKVLVENSETVALAFRARAEAAAYASLAVESYKKAILAEQIEGKIANDKALSFKAGDKIPSNLGQYKNVTKGYGEVDAEGEWRFTEKGAEAASEWMKSTAGRAKYEKEANDYTQKQVDKLAEVDALLASIGIKQAENNNNKPNMSPGYEAGSLADIDAQINAINDSLRNELLTEDEQIKKIQQLNELYAKRNKLEQELKNSRAKAFGVEPIDLSGLEPRKPVELKVNIKPKVAEVETTTMLETVSTAVGGFSSLNGAIKSVYDTWSSLSDSIKDDNPFEATLTVVGAILSTLQSICSVIETVNALSEMFGAIKNGTLLIEKKITGEKVKQVALDTADVIPTQQKAVANVASGVGSVADSAGDIPYIGWALALTAVAALIGLLASAKSSVKFAKGGIVPGSSMMGDNVSAQLNSGEMVLNTVQQKRLFDMLNGAGSYGGNNRVEFVIKGQELKGVLNNYEKKINYI